MTPPPSSERAGAREGHGGPARAGGQRDGGDARRARGLAVHVAELAAPELLRRRQRSPGLGDRFDLTRKLTGLAKCATWPSILTENPDQRPGLGPRFGPTLRSFLLPRGPPAAAPQPRPPAPLAARAPRGRPQSQRPAARRAPPAAAAARAPTSAGAAAAAPPAPAPRRRDFDLPLKRHWAPPAPGGIRKPRRRHRRRGTAPPRRPRAWRPRAPRTRRAGGPDLGWWLLVSRGVRR